MNKIRLNHLVMSLIVTTFTLGIISPTASVAQTKSGRAAEPLAGLRTTQTIVLGGGWNSIYLELEPDNPSALVNLGTEKEPFLIHESSTIEAIFGDVAGLEEIWGGHVPTSSADYIIDPSEAGAWNNAGWRRYVTELGASNPNSRQDIPTNLVSLHANRGYLVKLANDAADVTLTITGLPEVNHPRWLPNTYNLAGFPLLPDASLRPTVQEFFANSPITEVFQLSRDGTWERMVNRDLLQSGQAYLVFVDSQSATAAESYAARLNLLGVPSDGMHFMPGSGGQNRTFQVENRADGAIKVTASLLDGADDGTVALYLSEPVDGHLVDDPVEFDIGAESTVQVVLTVPSAEQADDGAVILALASADLGVRWLIPVTARSGSLAGLWVGDVTVNDVSESRLGGTNVADGQLTVALRNLDSSGIQGVAHLAETVAPSGNPVTFSLQVNSAPSEQAAADADPFFTSLSQTPTEEEGGFIAGYLFVDANQNGQRDGEEMGFAGRTVTLDDGSESITIQTDDNGAYRFDDLVAARYAINIDTPVNYTSTFEVELPNRSVTQATSTNLRPDIVTMADDRIDTVEPVNYLSQVMPADFVALPYEDSANQPLEPLINFGFVPTYKAALWTTSPSGCSSLRSEEMPLGQVVNGELLVTQGIGDDSAAPGGGISQLLASREAYAILLTDTNGDSVACGEVRVGSPTRLADGRGSEFTFRILLRVDKDGRTELLPYYETKPSATGEVTRISSANFSLTNALQASGTYGNEPLGLAITVAPNDPRNPFKHKYHPDHDNLDRQFLPIDLASVNPNLWESYEIRRQIRLESVDNLTAIPAFADLDAAAAQALAVDVDWGGATWGGLYHEVMSGVHKNDITVQGHFVVRHILTADQLEEQPYD